MTRGKNRAARSLLAFAIVIVGATAGCQELVHMGQLSDRESSFAVNNAKIEQLQSDGSWKYLGSTDGNGRWWIIKEKMSGGGKIRVSKPGYYPIVLSDNEFLQQFNILMTPTGSAGNFGESMLDPRAR